MNFLKVLHYFFLSSLVLLEHAVCIQCGSKNHNRPPVMLFKSYLLLKCLGASLIQGTKYKIGKFRACYIDFKSK